MKDSDGDLKYEDEDDYYEKLEDMDEDDFEDINGTQRVYVNGDADQFGDDEPEFIMVHLNKNGRIDATVEIEDATDYKVKDFATSEVDEEQVTPNPSDDKEATVKVTITPIGSLEVAYIDVTDVDLDDAVSFNIDGKSKNKEIDGENKDFTKSKDGIKVYLLDADGDKLGYIMVDGTDEGTQTLDITEM